MQELDYRVLPKIVQGAETLPAQHRSLPAVSSSRTIDELPMGPVPGGPVGARKDPVIVGIAVGAIGAAIILTFVLMGTMAASLPGEWAVLLFLAAVAVVGLLTRTRSAPSPLEAVRYRRFTDETIHRTERIEYDRMGPPQSAKERGIEFRG